MILAEQYARALHAAVQKNPSQSSAYIKNLHGVVQRRGHERLLSHILKQYEHLESNSARKAQLKEITPEMVRTKTLVELYKKLISA